jgi:hypothetical protein
MIPETIQPFVLPVKKLIYRKQIQDFCMLPYPGHSKGCPNYGVRDHCPPKVGLIDQYLDVTKPMWLVIEEFSLAGHIQRMIDLHPHWSDRQARCCLYWQKGVRNKLKQKVDLVMSILGTTAYTTIPEGQGVQMYSTCLHSGLKLERIKGLKLHRQIAIVGYRL